MLRRWFARFNGEGADCPELPARLLKSHKRERRVATVLALSLSLLLAVAGVSELLDNRLGSFRAQLLDRPPTGEIAIVGIDEKSIAALKKWPWSRRYHAELVNRLHEAGASMIAFDVDFSAESDSAGDQAFAKALRNVEPVVLPIFQQRASDDPTDRRMIKNRPADAFSSGWVGSVNILPGPDGVVRDFPAATFINGQVHPSMPVVLSEDSTLGDRTFVPDWSIDAQRIPRISFIDVLKGHLDKRLEGKRVIVGATAIELGDRYTIPRFGTVPGVVIQALAADTLLQHRALLRSGPLPTLLGLLAIAFLLGRSFGNFRRWFPITAASIIAALLIGPLLVQWRWPLSIDTGALLIAAGCFIAGRIVVEARHHARARALTDAETGLLNDAALQAETLERTGNDLSLVAASIDRFDQIRSALVPAATASVIQEVARRISRATDSKVYRIAPDTIGWFTSSAKAELDALQARGVLTDAVIVSGDAVDIHLTFGLASCAGGSGLCHTQALSAIKSARSTGARLQWFEGVGARERRDLSMMGDLRRGIADGEVFVAYQPKLNLKTNMITHVEALVRWQHPSEGLISPDRFVPLAEETGTVRELTRFVLRKAISDCAKLSAPGSHVHISVNVSALDISERAFADQVLSELRAFQLDPQQLTLEITESAIIRSPATAMDVLHAVREGGVRLSIDDYGTGQSTLSYLKALPVDELKIDKSFVTEMAKNESDRIMVKSTIEMAHELGLLVVAEGVEDRDTIDLLQVLKCDFVQGYAIGKASSPDILWPQVFGQLSRKVA